MFSLSRDSMYINAKGAFARISPPHTDTAVHVNRNKFVRAVSRMNACNLWSTWFMDAYLFINQECGPVSILFFCHRIATHRTNASQMRTDTARYTWLWVSTTNYACRLLYECACASRTASLTFRCYPFQWLVCARWTALKRFNASHIAMIVLLFHPSHCSLYFIHVSIERKWIHL